MQDIYQTLLDLMSSITLITVTTGKRTYTNMLITSVTTETTNRTENSLECLISCKQVILVQTTVVAVGAPASQQANPAKTASLKDLGSKLLSSVHVDKGSILGGAIKNLVTAGSQFGGNIKIAASLLPF